MLSLENNFVSALFFFRSDNSKPLTITFQNKFWSIVMLKKPSSPLFTALVCGSLLLSCSEGEAQFGRGCDSGGSGSSGSSGGPGGGGFGAAGCGGSLEEVPQVPLEDGRTRRSKDCRASSSESESVTAIIADLETQLDDCESTERLICEEGNGKFSIFGETLDVNKRYGRAVSSSGVRYLECDYLNSQAPPVPSLIDLFGPLPLPVLPYPTEVPDEGPTLPPGRTID